MNIALISSYYLPVLGGVEKNIQEIAFSLAKEGHNIFVITNQINDTTIKLLGSEDVVPIPTLPAVEKVSEKVTIIRLPLPSYLLAFKHVNCILSQPASYILYNAKKIATIVKRLKIDVCYAAEPPSYLSLFVSIFLSGMIKKNVRTVAGIRSSNYVTSWFRRLVGQIVMSSFDAVIVSNVNILSYEYAKKLSSFNTYFIPNWVDTSRFKPYDQMESRRKLGIEGYDKVVLSVGRFVSEKGTMQVLMGFHKALSETNGNQKAVLVLVGAGPLMQSITQYIKNNHLENNVKIIKPFAFEDTNYPILYSICDIFIHLPRHDGLSNVVTEALASGVPVVIHSKVRGIPKEVQSHLKLVDVTVDKVSSAILDSFNFSGTIEERNAKRLCAETYFSKAKLLPLFHNVLLAELTNHS